MVLTIKIIAIYDLIIVRYQMLTKSVMRGKAVKVFLTFFENF